MDEPDLSETLKSKRQEFCLDDVKKHGDTETMIGEMIHFEECAEEVRLDCFNDWHVHIKKIPLCSLNLQFFLSSN